VLQVPKRLDDDKYATSDSQRRLLRAAKKRFGTKSEKIPPFTPIVKVIPRPYVDPNPAELDR